MAWQSSTINPATTSPAADITKITNDLQVLRTVLGGGADGDVPLTPAAFSVNGTLTVQRQDSSSEGGQINLNRANDNTTAWAIDVVGSTASPSIRFINVGGGSTTPLTIDGGGSVGLGRAPLQALDVQTSGLTIVRARGGSAAGHGAGFYVTQPASDSAMAAFGDRSTAFGGTPGVTASIYTGAAIPLTVDVGAATRMQFGISGEIYFPGVGTTASAANAFLNSGSTPANQLLRSTSSLRYKTDVRDLPASYLDAVLELRPVVYKSNAEADDKALDWVGLIAEEVAEVAPRLVHYTTLEEGGELVPDGVQYDRLTVLLLGVVKQLKADNDNLKARVAALEA